MFNKSEWQRNYMKERRAGKLTREQELLNEIDRLNKEVACLKAGSLHANIVPGVIHSAPATPTPEGTVTPDRCAECMTCKRTALGMCSGNMQFNDCPQYWA